MIPFRRHIRQRVRKSLLRTETPSSCCRFFNLNSWLLKSGSRLKWDGSNFVVVDKNIPGFSYKFRHQRQGTVAYERGIRTRAESLADTYHLRKIDFKDGDVFLDCGANVGDLKLWFSINHIDLNYVGFEPSPIEFDCLKENIYPSKAFNFGLWSHDGELKFYVSSQGADSRVIEPKHYDEVIHIKVKRLADVIEGDVKCLKLEAEGAEPEVLEGAGEKLNHVEYVSADLGYERGVNEESTLVPVTNYLLQRGFELVDVTHGRICALYKNMNLAR